MPGVIRKLLIVAAADGLILHPHPHGHASRPSTDEPSSSSSSSSSSIRIEYKTSKVTLFPTAVLSEEKKDGNGSASGSGNGSVGIEAYGLVGMFISPRPADRQTEGKQTKANGKRPAINYITIHIPNPHYSTPTSRQYPRKPDLCRHERRFNPHDVTCGCCARHNAG